MTRCAAILVAWLLLHVSNTCGVTPPTQQNKAYEELQRKYEAALQEIERLRSELEALKRERSAAQPPPTGGAEAVPGDDPLQVGSALFAAQRYTEAIAAYTKYKSPLKRGRKTGNVLSNVSYHLHHTGQENGRCQDGTLPSALPLMITPALP